MCKEDLLSELRGLAADVTAQEGKLREHFRRLSDSLIEIFKGIEISGESGLVTFWECEPMGDFEHGHLTFSSENGIRVSYCDLHGCMAEADQPDPYNSRYTSCDSKEVPIDWLRRAVAEGKLDELLDNLCAELRKHVMGLGGASQAVERLIATPTRAIGTAFADVACEIGYESLVDDWRTAEGEILTDPASAITRACSLVETVCKHLLEKLGRSLPADKSIYPLFKTTAKELGLDPAEQANPELKGLCGGLATVVQQIGALRTKFSTAHGNSPDDKPLTFSHARLTVNAAGVIAAFLMEQWKTKTET